MLLYGGAQKGMPASAGMTACEGLAKSTNEKAAHRAALSGYFNSTYAGSFESASLMRAHFVSSSLTRRSFAAG